MKKGLFVSLWILILVASAFAGGDTEAAAADPVEISWQVWITPNMTREYYDGVVSAYKAVNPDVAVEIVETSAAVDSNAGNFIRNRLISGDVPDIWSNIDTTEFIDAGHVWAYPLDDPDLDRLKDPMGVAYNGKVYGLNTAIQPQGSIFYNKTLWAQAGLDESDIPTTFEEFDAVCAALKDAGITPIVTGGEWVSGALFAWLGGPQFGIDNPEFWADYRAGKIRFTDPEIMETIQWIDGLAKKGYFNEGALSIGYAQLEQEFLNGAAAMYPMGTWFTAAEGGFEKDWECGVFINPSDDGTRNFIHGGGYGRGWIYSGSENPEEAYEFQKWYLMESEYASRSLEIDGLFSNMNPPAEYDMTPLQLEVQGLVTAADMGTPQIHSNLGGSPPAGILDAFGTVMEAILIQSYSDLTEEVQKIDDFIIDLEGL